MEYIESSELSSSALKSLCEPQRILHVSISTAKGVKPVYSNTLLHNFSANSIALTPPPLDANESDFIIQGDLGVFGDSNQAVLVQLLIFWQFLDFLAN